jgi:hypothetical protein
VNDVTWTELFRGRGETAVTATVPPADAGGPRLAVVRIGWDPKDQPQATTLTAEVQANLGPATDFLHFEVPIMVVPPIISSHDQLQPIQLGDLRPGDKRQETVYLWSSTRDRFDVKLQPAVADPCIEASAPRPLTADELKRLPDDLIAAGLIRSKTRPKCGYAVTVTAYENRGDNQLELGPLSRRLFVNRGADTEVAIVLTGTVRGSIRVGEPPDTDHVDLRVFPAARGTERMVTLKSAEPGLELTVDHVTPDQVEAKLQPSQPGFGTRLWKLIVKVPPDALAGPLPSDSAIYLKTNTTPPRRIRIPVRGNASG